MSHSCLECIGCHCECPEPLYLLINGWHSCGGQLEETGKFNSYYSSEMETYKCILCGIEVDGTDYESWVNHAKDAECNCTHKKYCCFRK